MRNARYFLFATLIISLLAFVPAAVAQITSGTITGVVTDTSGAAVAGASVTIASTQTGSVRTATTNSEGNFSFPELSPGAYNITVTKQGFKKVEQRGVEAHVADLTNVTIKMPVGGMVETVEVQASAVQVETQTGVVGNLVTGQEVRELPMNGRNFVQLTTLMPGAAVAENFDGKNKGLLAGVDISFSGAPANANQWRVDGANNNDIGSQRTILVYPSIDAIEEFKILRNSYGPEFGGAGGAQINIVTRGGGNDFHGSAYYFGRNDALNAKNYLLGPTDHKQLLRRNDYGYTIGGPIKKDKVFFFWSQEWNKEKRARVRAFQVPTTAELGGDFRDLQACPSQIPKDPGNPDANGKFQPFTFNGQTNVIDPARLSPAGLAFLSQLAPTNRNNPCGINWVQGVTIPVNWREENVRGDVNITKSTVLTLRYTQDSWKNPLHSDEEGGLWGEQAYPSLSGNWDQPGKVAIAKLTTTIGTSATNDFSFSWSANRINIAIGGDTPALNDTIKAAFQTVFPQSGKLHGAATASPLCWCGGASGLIGHFGPWNNGQDLFTWKDDYSKVMGRHILRAGIYYSKNKKDEETGSDFGGLWGNGYSGAIGYGTNVWSGATGNEYADFLLKGTVWGYGENVSDGKALARWSDLEFYVGDSWKARPRLTLEYGFRWAFTPPVYDANNNYSSFRPDLYKGTGATCDGILLPSGSSNTCPGATVGTNRSLAPSNYHLIAPRLGIAWDVFGTGKTAFRVGGGQFYQRERLSNYLYIATNSPFSLSSSGTRTLSGAADPANLTSAADPGWGMDPRNVMPNTWQWNLTFERQLYRDSKIELAYVGNRGSNILSYEDATTVPAPLLLPVGPETELNTLPHAVERQNGRLVVRRREERARRVRFVVFREDVSTAILASQGLVHDPRQEQLLPHPQRHAHQEELESTRRVRDVGLQQPLELQERLVVERHVVDLLGGDARLAQAVFDRMRRESMVVLLACEAFLLRRGDDHAVANQRGGAIVIEGGDPQDVHL